MTSQLNIGDTVLTWGMKVKLVSPHEPPAHRRTDQSIAFRGTITNEHELGDPFLVELADACDGSWVIKGNDHTAWCVIEEGQK